MMIISFTGLVQDFMRKFRKVTATVRVCLLRSILIFLPTFLSLHSLSLSPYLPFLRIQSGVVTENELISRKKPWN
jgi:hypothetical protein